MGFYVIDYTRLLILLEDSKARTDKRVSVNWWIEDAVLHITVHYQDVAYMFRHSVPNKETFESLPIEIKQFLTKKNQVLSYYQTNELFQTEEETREFDSSDYLYIRRYLDSDAD